MNTEHYLDPTIPIYEALEKAPELYGQENEKDPIVYAVLRNKYNNWVRFVTEYDPTEQMIFSLVYGFEKEWGYADLNELLDNGTEMDAEFDGPKKLSEYQNILGINYEK